MISKKCTLSDKEKLRAVLHGECADTSDIRQNDCVTCSFFVSKEMARRRLTLKIQTDIQNILSPFVQKPSTTLVQKSIDKTVSTYLNNLMSRRRISDYRVICDETNNTNSQLNVVDVYVKPTRSVNIINMNFVVE